MIKWRFWEPERLAAALEPISPGRAMTSCSLINGLVVKKGKEAGVPTPLNEAIVALTRQIQFGELKPERSNLELLKHLMNRHSA